MDIQTICKKLHENYNGDILNEIKDNDIREIFREISKKYKDGKKGNIPLLNIVHNHFNGVLPTPKYLSGPMSLSYQTSDKYNMKIYIFGEWHGKGNECSTLKKPISSYIDMRTYLQNLFLNSNKFIDFYLEDQLFSRDLHKEENGTLEMLRNYFKNCLNPAKRKECIFKTVRAHFVDARMIQLESGEFYSTNPIGKLISDLEIHIPIIPYMPSIVNNIIKVHKNTIDIFSTLKTYEDLAKYIQKIAIEIPIIKKELDRCRLDKKLLFSVFHDTMVEMYPLFFDIKIWIKYLRLKKLDFDFYILLTILQGPIVDFYTITRMFKTFKEGNNFPTKPKYIIYYAGYAHSLILRKFLEKLKFKWEIYRQSDAESSTRCLDISGIKLDFK